MEVRITVADDDTSKELQSLLGWLRREDGMAPPRLAPGTPAAHEMGALSDGILLVLASGGMAGLTRSVSVWLRQRRGNVKVTIHTPDGRTVEIDGSGIPVADAVRLADRAIDEAGPKAGGSE